MMQDPKLSDFLSMTEGESQIENPAISNTQAFFKGMTGS